MQHERVARVCWRQLIILLITVFGRPFVKRFALCYHTVVCLSVLSCLSVTLVYCDQTVGRIKTKLGTQVGHGTGHIVLDGVPAPPPPKGGRAPHFLAHICCSQMAVGIKMPLGMEVRPGPGNFLLDRDPAPSPKRGRTPKFSAHVYCDQTVGWVKMVLGMEVCLSPGDCVRLGPSYPQKKGTPTHAIFGPCLLWPKGWMDEDATW